MTLGARTPGTTRKSEQAHDIGPLAEAVLRVMSWDPTAWWLARHVRERLGEARPKTSGNMTLAMSRLFQHGLVVSFRTSKGEEAYKLTPAALSRHGRSGRRVPETRTTGRAPTSSGES